MRNNRNWLVSIHFKTAANRYLSLYEAQTMKLEFHSLGLCIAWKE